MEQAIEEMGFLGWACGPLVRSSYKAGELLAKASARLRTEKEERYHVGERKGVNGDIYRTDAPFRPGDDADFGGSWKEQPGDLSRPDPVECTAPETHDHAHGLIRVLGDDDSASGEWNPELDAAELIKGLEMMMRLRIFDDRMIKMQRTEKLIFLHAFIWRRSDCNRSNDGTR